VWVVNQDNDSVTVFDCRNARQAARDHRRRAPRSIARAANGMLWVAKQARRIDQRDRSEFTRCQPHDRVAGARRNRSVLPWCRVSARHSLRRGDGRCCASTPFVCAKPVRRVSAQSAPHCSQRRRCERLRLVVHHAGAAGEATATVQTRQQRSVGGQVVRLLTTSMGRREHHRLAHSERPDFENQGRGIPNYLGALALSPDATQGLSFEAGNIKRGACATHRPDFQSTVRA